MSLGGTGACVIPCRSVCRLFSTCPDSEVRALGERTKSAPQPPERSSPRRPNTLTRSLHRSAVAGCTCTDMARRYRRPGVVAIAEPLPGITEARRGRLGVYRKGGPNEVSVTGPVRCQRPSVRSRQLQLAPTLPRPWPEHIADYGRPSEVRGSQQLRRRYSVMCGTDIVIASAKCRAVAVEVLVGRGHWRHYVRDRPALPPSDGQ